MNPQVSVATVVIAVVMLAADGVGAESCNETHCIEWSSLDSGGTIESSTDDDQYQLAGTIGQWDASASAEMDNDDHRLTGGFWAYQVELIVDRIFSDRFEAD